MCIIHRYSVVSLRDQRGFILCRCLVGVASVGVEPCLPYGGRQVLWSNNVYLKNQPQPVLTLWGQDNASRLYGHLRLRCTNALLESGSTALTLRYQPVASAWYMNAVTKDDSALKHYAAPKGLRQLYIHPRLELACPPCYINQCSKKGWLFRNKVGLTLVLAESS